MKAAFISARWAIACDLPNTPPQHDVTSQSDNQQTCGACHNFGSAHPSTWNAVYCDGSVHSLTFTMSFATHRALASRAAGDSANPKEN